jgi:hypothetical protein
MMSVMKVATIRKPIRARLIVGPRFWSWFERERLRR